MAKMICITEDGAFMASDQMTAVELFNILLNTNMQMFQNLLKQAPDKGSEDQLRAELYDLFNAGASAFLKAFDPDRELRPDLTAEAILKAENELIEEKTHSLQGSVEQSAARIRKQMEKDGIITKVRQEGDNIIPLNRAERRRTKK